MNWTEQSTREYLDRIGAHYETYTALGQGDTYEQQSRNCHQVLELSSNPYHSMLRYGSIGDTVEDEKFIKRLVARRGTHWIVQDEATPDHNCAFYLADATGCEGAECQIGETLESFIAYLDAWLSMAETPGPFAPLEV